MTGERAVVGRGSRGGLALHLGCALAVFCVCVLSPRAGQAALLVPLPRQPAVSLHQILVRHGLTLVGRGRIAGTWVVRAPRGSFDWTIVADGLVPIAVPAALCGAVA